MQSLCDSPGFFEEGRIVTARKAGTAERKLTISGIRFNRDRLLVSFDGISDRNRAEALRSLDLYTSRSELAPVRPDEIYHSDLLDCTVLDSSGNRVGKVGAIHGTAGAPLLEIDTANGRFLLPFVEEYIAGLRQLQHEIVIRNFEPLLDLNR